MRTESFDFAIIGSGFGGSIMSMVLRRLGKSVLLLERGRHPRFAIGESSTPFANLLLERLAADYDLPFLRALSEWGRWQDNFTELPVGLKRGFTFYYHSPGEPLDFADPGRQLLVAASPNDRVADTHWYRPAFDEFLVQKARELGVDYRDEATISSTHNHGGRWTMTITRREERFQIAANFLIDASGPSGFAPLQNPAVPCPFMPATSAVYAHFREVPRLDQLDPRLRDDSLPYPPDDAAVHHVFPGGWIWVLRFNNGITSAGAAFSRRRSGESSSLACEPERLLTSSPTSELEALWRSILKQLPTVERAFPAAVPITPFYFTPQLSFRRERAAGPGWAALPSAAGFVDPLLSTGFALTLFGIGRLAAAFAGISTDFTAYEKQTLLELDATADLVSALYSKMSAPEEFSLLSLLYFAAMSYTETAWRLGKCELASGFLLTNNVTFSAARAEVCAQARAEAPITRDLIARIINPFDVAGLTDWRRAPRYPVHLDDLRQNAWKLQANDAEMAALLAKLSTSPQDEESFPPSPTTGARRPLRESFSTD